MKSTLLPNQTTASTSSPVVVTSKRVTFVATGTLAAGETVDIQVETVDGTFANLFQDGSQVQLTDTNNAITIEGPGKYRVNKGATTAGAGAVLYGE